MAGPSDQITILIGSDRDRKKEDRSMINRLIAIPLDQCFDFVAHSYTYIKITNA